MDHFGAEGNEPRQRTAYVHHDSAERERTMFGCEVFTSCEKQSYTIDKPRCTVKHAIYIYVKTQTAMPIRGLLTGDCNEVWYLHSCSSPI